jgi:Domain of unknown function (DUF4440)
MGHNRSLRRATGMRALLALAGATLTLMLTAAAALPHPDAADQLRALERARLHALVVGDTATAGRFIARDFQLINPGGATASKDDYLAGVQAGFPDYLVFQPSGPIAVRLAGNSASLRFPVSFDLLLGDLRLTHQAWVSELWERRGGRWQIVWEQATAIPNNFDLFVESLKPVG